MVFPWIYKGALSAAGIAALVACGGDGSDATGQNGLPSIAQLRKTCTELTGQTFSGVVVTSAQRVESGGAVPAGLCQVRGTRAPYLDMEVVLPDNWSKRYWQQGGGGFDGNLASALSFTGNQVTSLNKMVANHSAIYAASNGGNRASVPGQAAPALWGTSTPEARESEVDYAYRALETTNQFANALSHHFYNQEPTYRYFSGCSNGGRNAYLMAERMPDAFDGIVSGCEPMDMGTQTTAWMIGASTPVASQLSEAQSAHAYSKALEQCDALDGAKDGIVARFDACHFDPVALQCGAPAASADPAICLNAGQVNTLRTYLNDIYLADGRLLYKRFPWATGLSRNYGFLGSGFMVLATHDGAWLNSEKQATFQADAMYDTVKSGLMARGADHNKDAVAQYIASGKKLISWHAGSDALLSPIDHIHNWNTMTQRAGTFGASNISAVSRFFVVPGASHGQGASLEQVDWGTAIVQWVENGSAPTQLTYRFEANGTQRSIPVCEYPKYAKYKGSGDLAVHSSYECAVN